jgi:hypothetical protein
MTPEEALDEARSVADCPHVGNGGYHSEDYLTGDGPCIWCGRPAPQLPKTEPYAGGPRWLDID